MSWLVLPVSWYLEQFIYGLLHLLVLEILATANDISWRVEWIEAPWGDAAHGFLSWPPSVKSTNSTVQFAPFTVYSNPPGRAEGFAMSRGGGGRGWWWLTRKGKWLWITVWWIREKLIPKLWLRAPLLVSRGHPGILPAKWEEGYFSIFWGVQGWFFLIKYVPTFIPHLTV